MLRILLTLMLYLSASYSANAALLCLPNETVVFSCEIGTKSVTVCSAKNETLLYRFGTEKHVELELESPIHFSRTAYSGGGEGNLTFIHGSYKYIVYSSISSGKWREDGTREKIERAGVYIVRNEQLVDDLECTDFTGDTFIGELPPHVEEGFRYYD